MGLEVVDIAKWHDIEATTSAAMARLSEELQKRSRSQRRITVAAAWLLGGGVLLILFAIASLHTITISPDGSTVLLEGAALNGGNLTLHGWSLALDSFWTLDAPFYAFAVRIFGVKPLLLNVVPALIAVLVVVVAMRIAAGGRVGTARVVAMVSVLALLALPSPDLVDYFLQGPWHIATTLCCLLAFAGASRSRFGWPWALAVVMLAAGLLGDLMILVIGVAPVMAAGLVYMCRTRSWRAGLPALSAGVAGVLGAVAIRELADLVGTFSLVSRNLALHGSLLSANVRHLPTRFAALVGVGSLKIKGVSNGPWILQAFHAVGLAVVVVVAIAALVALVRGAIDGGSRFDGGAERHIDDFLVLALVADFVFFSVASQSGNLEFAKYLTPGVVFAAALVGRATGRLVPVIRQRGIWRVGIAVGVSLCVAYGVDFSYELSRAEPARPAYALAQFLSSHDLRSGVGDYWSASLVTVEADAAVEVRPVSTASGKIIQFNRQSDAEWYRAHKFEFLVYDTARPWHDVNKATAVATFGPPSQVYSVGTYRVLEWKSGIQIASASTHSGLPLSISMSAALRPLPAVDFRPAALSS